jgi:hypothetical protein
VVMSQLSPALPLFAQRGAIFHWSAREENFLVSPRNPLSAGSSFHGKTRGRGTPYGLDCSRRDEVLSSSQTQPTMAYVDEISTQGIQTGILVTILDARTNTRIGGNAYGIYTNQTVDLLFEFRFRHLPEETEFHVVQVQSYGHRSHRSSISAAADRAVQEFANAYDLRRDFTRWETPPK